ncbi:TrkH family potassium uptake protein [Boudabousia liubingyangii]|uniref:TrkH family potassium uptake protein n=1 Tax=Boudabousia liubingyangii TaxID=1921764 RepID=UPI0009F98DAC|nr:potassium transporter TrkG [Boudabousia liubingyangii]
MGNPNPRTNRRRSPRRPKNALQQTLGTVRTPASHPLAFEPNPEIDPENTVVYHTAETFVQPGQKVTMRDRLKFALDRAARSSPARLALGVFALFILLITSALMLPISTRSGEVPRFVDALFTATSAVCVTGLSVQDTITYWSVFGQAMIALGIAVGGLGIMTLSSILALAVSRRIGLAQKMLAASERKAESLGDVGMMLRAVIITSALCEGILFAVFFPRFLTLGEGTLEAAWHATFMSISTFNNAGFETIHQGLGHYVEDWWMLMPIAVGTTVGALGFPVVHDVWENLRRPSKWTLHTKLTLTTYGSLAAISAIVIPLNEWNNPRTFGSLSFSGKMANTVLGAVNTRSTGLSAVDISGMKRTTWLMQDIFMFIGGGSGSTAGGLKVTTVAVLILAFIAEARGNRDIEAFKRRIPTETIRVAVSIAIISTITVITAVWILMQMTAYSLDMLLFESVSAFGTVGLSTGIAMDPALADGPKYVFTALMFAGRTGTMTVAAALAMRQHLRLFRYPPESPAIG